MRPACALTLLLAAVPAFAGNAHYYAPDLQHRRLAKRVRSMPTTLQKRSNNGFGLKDSSATLYKNDVAIGFLPNFETTGAVNAINAPVRLTPSRIDVSDPEQLDEPISLIGDFVQIYANEDQQPQPLIQVDYHVANVTAANAAQQPVYVIALMPQGAFALERARTADPCRRLRRRHALRRQRRRRQDAGAQRSRHHCLAALRSRGAPSRPRQKRAYPDR
jgi:hypothetical protein